MIAIMLTPALQAPTVPKSPGSYPRGDTSGGNLTLWIEDGK